MGKKGSSTIRTTVSIPRDLKRRMDKVAEDVNWSALACQAFQEKLAEIAARKEEKTMDDVVERLRASKRKMDSEEYQHGYENGRAWANDTAEAAELERLESLEEGLKNQPVYGWEFFFDSQAHPNSAYSTAEDLYFALQPNDQEDRDRDAAKDFWESAAGDSELSDSYVRGFAEGALQVWRQVKPQL